MKVLLVEDEHALADVMSRNIRAHGHSVQTAASAGEAWRLIDEEAPDVMVLDINLPDESGWEVLRRLGDKRDAIRVVVISAAPLSSKRLQELKPTRWFLKPFPWDALMRALEGTPAEEPQEV